MNLRIVGLTAGALFFVIGAGQVYLAQGLGRWSLQEPGPGLFPTAVGSFMCVASLAYMAELARGERVRRVNFADSAGRVVVFLAALMAFTALLPRIGFFLPAVLLQMVVLRIFSTLPLWKMLVAGVIGAAVAKYLFENILGVRFPEPHYWGTLG
jgi:putative tricarboxylic transport membrane protein